MTNETNELLSIGELRGFDARAIAGLLVFWFTDGGRSAEPTAQLGKQVVAYVIEITGETKDAHAILEAFQAGFATEWASCLPDQFAEMMAADEDAAAAREVAP